jgi:hypothetical protein
MEYGGSWQGLKLARSEAGKVAKGTSAVRRSAVWCRLISAVGSF